MSFIFWNCDLCKHQRENIDGWRCACDAFPEGIPRELLFTSKKTKDMVDCNNGIGFEIKEEYKNDPIFNKE